MNFIKDEDGQSVIVVAVFLGIVGLGFLGLALDTGNLMRQQRMVQSAADAAAVAAAQEVFSGNPGNKTTVANAIAKMNGFDTTLATNPATVTFPTPPVNFSGSVAVTVSKPIQNLFMGAFNPNFRTQIVSATGVAGGGTISQTCLCLDGTSGQTLSLAQNNHLIASGCGIIDNSNSATGVGLVGSSTLVAASLGLHAPLGSVSLSGTANTGATIIVPGVASCSQAMPPAPVWGTCLDDPGGNWGTFVWGPASSSGTICYKNLTVGANGSTCTLNPGIYVITGTLHFLSGDSGGHSNYGGNGVFFYLTGTANLIIDNNANVNLVASNTGKNGGGTAPSLGSSYDGVAIYQATGDGSPITIQGGSTSYIGGAIYAPSAPMFVGNGSQMTNAIGGIVASSLDMTASGGATLKITNDTNMGALAVGNAKLVQ
ncbi:MAG: pilus assembly protein TadG-related protein [Acidobacteriota bacterium]|nr:pilus assembly protein TadG-related protein [Acidobacteriota bacterium]